MPYNAQHLDEKKCTSWPQQSAVYAMKAIKLPRIKTSIKTCLKNYRAVNSLQK